MSHRAGRNFWDRREFLFRSGGGISGLALAYLLDRQGLLSADSTAQNGADLIRRQSLASFAHVVLNLDEFLYMR